MKRSLSSRYGKWAVVAGASQGFGASFAAELAGHRPLRRTHRYGVLSGQGSMLPRGP